MLTAKASVYTKTGIKTSAGVTYESSRLRNMPNGVECITATEKENVIISFLLKTWSLLRSPINFSESQTSSPWRDVLLFLIEILLQKDGGTKP